MTIVRSDGEMYTTSIFHRRRHVFEVKGLRRKFVDQYKHALRLMEENFDLLQHHYDYAIRGIRGDVPAVPSIDIECRGAMDYASCHWSRYPFIYFTKILPLHCF